MIVLAAVFALGLFAGFYACFFTLFRRAFKIACEANAANKELLALLKNFGKGLDEKDNHVQRSKLPN